MTTNKIKEARHVTNIQVGRLLTEKFDRGVTVALRFSQMEPEQRVSYMLQATANYFDESLETMKLALTDWRLSHEISTDQFDNLGELTDNDSKQGKINAFADNNWTHFGISEVDPYWLLARARRNRFDEDNYCVFFDCSSENQEPIRQSVLRVLKNNDIQISKTLRTKAELQTVNAREARLHGGSLKDMLKAEQFKSIFARM